MSKTDWAVLGLNALMLLAAVVGLMASQTDPMGYGLVLAFVATTSTPTSCSASTRASRRSLIRVSHAARQLAAGVRGDEQTLAPGHAGLCGWRRASGRVSPPPSFPRTRDPIGKAKPTTFG